MGNISHAKFMIGGSASLMADVGYCNMPRWIWCASQRQVTDESSKKNASLIIWAFLGVIQKDNSYVKNHSDVMVEESKYDLAVLSNCAEQAKTNVSFAKKPFIKQVE